MQLLLLGSRNTVDQDLNLLQRAARVRLIYDQGMTRQAQDLCIKHLELLTHEQPPHHELVTQTTIPHPFSRTFSETGNDPDLILIVLFHCFQCGRREFDRELTRRSCQ